MQQQSQQKQAVVHPGMLVQENKPKPARSKNGHKAYGGMGLPKSECPTPKRELVSTGVK